MSTQNFPAVIDLSPEKLQALTGILKEEGIEWKAKSVINQRPSSAEALLSSSQERIWFLDKLEPGNHYNDYFGLRIRGPLDYETLKRSIEIIERRHESLRTNFVSAEGQALQVIGTDCRVNLAVTDLSNLPESDRESEAVRRAVDEVRQLFDLTKDPLFRTRLFRLSGEEHIFLLTIHQIINDSWSLGVFASELLSCYRPLTQGREPELPSLPVQYADFAHWQRNRLQETTLSEQLSYWKGTLTGAQPILQLPTDRPRPATQTFQGRREPITLSANLTRELKRLSQREDTTLFMTLMAAFKVLLYRYTGQEDIIVGLPISIRTHAELEGLIGMFVNTLVLRTSLSDAPSFRELLARVREGALGAYAHQELPFELLVKETQPQRNLWRTPIFQVLFDYQSAPMPALDLPGLELTGFEIDSGTSKYDLTLYAGLQGPELKLAFVYNTDLFDAQSVARMLVHFKTLLEVVVADPGQCIADLSLKPAAEGDQEVLRARLDRPAGVFIEFRKDEIEQSIAARFAGQAAKYPERLAVKSKNYEWTYENLNTAVNQIAQSILGRCGDSEERIALLFDHDAPMIAGMLGALRAGKTYVPLDPQHPKERLIQIIEHSQATALLTNNKNLALAGELTKSDVLLIDIDSPSLTTPDLPVIDLPAIKPDRLAYILYTSGSTGQPKGVMQNHRNVLHYIRVYTNNLHLNADDRLTLLSSYCFDASVMDIYGALLNGATLCPIDIKEDGLAGLAEHMIAEEITVYHSTPTVYRYFLSELADHEELSQFPPFPKVRLVVLGGEKVNRTDVELYQQHFSDHCLFVNGLGPTEATVALQNFIGKKTKVSGDSVPVGFAVEDTEVLLLNQSGRPSEVFGEIAIKSAHVALGYWRNTEATAKTFGSSATVREGSSGRRIYRTGDMGRRLPDGSIKFEGRKDFQVKIRGFRVELGEIEATLAQHPQVREGLVVAHENGGGDTRLVAYVVPRREHAPKVSGTLGTSARAELREFLKQKLPEYMVPGSFVMIESLPLTSSGKLDRRALPAPELAESNGEREYLAARDSLEYQLTQVWEEVLERSPIGIRDNFFALGGHSLLAVRLFARIEKAIGKQLPLATLFQAQTIEDLARVLRRGGWQPPWSALVAIQASGTKPPLFCLHAAGGNVLFYRDLSRHLGPDQPFYGIQPVGLDGKRTRHTSIEDMAAHYIRELETVQPEGPYYLGGASLGGLIAFEMACQLHAKSEKVAFLALFDTFGPGYPLFLSSSPFRSKVLHYYRSLEHHVGSLRMLDSKGRVAYVRQKSRKARLALLRWYRRSRKVAWASVYDAIGRPLPEALIQTQDSLHVAATKYKPRPYPGSVTLFRASRQPPGIYPDPTLGWDKVSEGGLSVHEVPGYHAAIVSEPWVQSLINPLRECLNQVQSVS